MEHTPVAVVGAGPAGLATSAALRSHHIPHVLLERADTVASAWRGHYRRLHLHTPRDHSGLPFVGFPRDAPTYPAREDVVAYLTHYAKLLDLAPRLGVALRCARPGEAGWILDTSAGAISARRLVMATGYNRVPNRPTWPDEDTFQGAILHSRAYQDGAPFAGMRVLVVGLGNTGGEIAIDLWEHGARPTLSVRSPVHVVPRDALGLPAQVSSILMAPLPLRLQDAVITATSRLIYGDLTPLGLRRPEVGPATQIAQSQKIPLIDVGTVDLIRQGHIQVRPDLEAFTPTGVRFAGGQREDFDAVVLATGYRPRLTELVEGVEPALDAQGYPRRRGADAALPGLHFVGFSNPITGFLRQIRIDALQAAAAIAADLGGQP